MFGSSFQAVFGNVFISKHYLERKFLILWFVHFLMQFLIWSEFYLFQKTIEKPGNFGKIVVKVHHNIGANSMMLASIVWLFTNDSTHFIYQAENSQLNVSDIFQWLTCHSLNVIVGRVRALSGPGYLYIHKTGISEV